MEQQPISPSMTFKTQQEQDMYDMWSKRQIYEAYRVEYDARVLAEKRFNKLSTILAGVRSLVK